MQFFKDKVGITIVAVLFMCATFAAIFFGRNNFSHSFQSESKLNAMQVAIKNVNTALLPNHFEMSGESVRFINGHNVQLLNGKLRASRASLKQGLDSAYQASETNVSALNGWRLVEMQSSSKDSRSIQLFPNKVRGNCFLVYTEAGTTTNPKPANYDVISHGC